MNHDTWLNYQKIHFDYRTPVCVGTQCSVVVDVWEPSVDEVLPLEESAKMHYLPRAERDKCS